MDNEMLYTVRETAAKIGVTESAIRNATLQGRLAFIVRYGRKLISEADLQDYQRRTQPEGKKTSGRPRLKK